MRSRLETTGATALLLAAAAGAFGEEAVTATPAIAGELRLDEKAPVFLQLLAQDASGKEVVVRDQIVEPSPDALAQRRVRFVFAGLAPGRYALKAFEDLNGNGKIDIGPFGPKEPWATHRPVRPRFRPPRFEEMAFELKSSLTDLQLVLRR